MKRQLSQTQLAALDELEVACIELDSARDRYEKAMTWCIEVGIAYRHIGERIGVTEAAVRQMRSRRESFKRALEQPGAH